MRPGAIPGARREVLCGTGESGGVRDLSGAGVRDRDLDRLANRGRGTGVSFPMLLLALFQLATADATAVIRDVSLGSGETIRTTTIGDGATAGRLHRGHLRRRVRLPAPHRPAVGARLPLHRGRAARLRLLVAPVTRPTTPSRRRPIVSARCSTRLGVTPCHPRGTIDRGIHRAAAGVSPARPGARRVVDRRWPGRDAGDARPQAVTEVRRIPHQAVRHQGHAAREGASRDGGELGRHHLGHRVRGG